MTIPNWLWAGIGVLVGMVAAGFTLAPGMSAINNGLSCLVAECSDLAAQRSMAVAAWVMVAATVLSVIVASATLALLYATLGPAARSAGAAEETVRITKRISEQQARAYLNIREVTLDLRYPGFPRVSILVQNAGQSPANAVGMVLIFNIFEQEPDGIPHSTVIPDSKSTQQETLIRRLAHVPAQAAMRVDLGLPADKFDADAKAEELTFAVTGTIGYRDDFGRKSEPVAFILPGTKLQAKLYTLIPAVLPMWTPGPV